MQPAPDDRLTFRVRFTATSDELSALIENEDGLDPTVEHVDAVLVVDRNSRNTLAEYLGLRLSLRLGLPRGLISRLESATRGSRPVSCGLIRPTVP